MFGRLFACLVLLGSSTFAGTVPSYAFFVSYIGEVTDGFIGNSPLTGRIAFTFSFPDPRYGDATSWFAPGIPGELGGDLR